MPDSPHDSGPGSVEYVLIFAIFAVAVIAILNLFGSEYQSLLSQAWTAFDVSMPHASPLSLLPSAVH